MKEEQNKRMLQWHPAFYAGLQVELNGETAKLNFENEHQIGTKPKEIDVLIIKKTPHIPIQKNIGHIFRTHNIIEYKSPTDYLSVNDFYKVYGYACFYKADSSQADEIPIQEITITFVCYRHPKKLFSHLFRERHYEMERHDNGIYYIKGDFIPIQFILTTELSPEKNLWLGSLTNHLNEIKTAERLLTEYDTNKTNRLYQSLIEIIIQANKKTFSEVKEMSVCNALKELMHDELEEAKALGIQQANLQSIQILIKTCKELGDSKQNTAERLKINYSISDSETDDFMKKYW